MWIFVYNFKQLMDPEGPVESRLEIQIAPQKLKTQSDIRNWNQKGKRRANARSSRGQASRIQKTGHYSLWLGLCPPPLAVVWGWVNLILKVHELKENLLSPWCCPKAELTASSVVLMRGPWSLLGHCYSQGAVDPLSWIHKASCWVRR